MRVRWSFAAKRDLVELHDFHTDEPQLARRAARAIIDAVRLLRASPGLGRPGRFPGTRELMIPRVGYVIPYTIVRGELHLLRLLRSGVPWPDSLD